MMSVAIQNEFAAGLLDPELPVSRSIVGGSSLRRFAIYRNNVVVGLINALRRRFPATEQIVGEEFFAAMARVFLATHPPRSPLLMFYGDDLPEFVAKFPPAAALAYLPDVVRLEAARTRAYHAADADPADMTLLSNLDPSALAQVRVNLHPSTQVIRSPHPIVTIWAMNSGEIALAPVDDDLPEDALVARTRFDVFVRKLPAGGATFVEALSRGSALGEACNIAAAEFRFDLTSNLTGLIGSGLIAGFALPDLPKYNPDDDRRSAALAR